MTVHSLAAVSPAVRTYVTADHYAYRKKILKDDFHMVMYDGPHRYHSVEIFRHADPRCGLQSRRACDARFTSRKAHIPAQAIKLSKIVHI